LNKVSIELCAAVPCATGSQVVKEVRSVSQKTSDLRTANWDYNRPTAIQLLHHSTLIIVQCPHSTGSPTLTGDIKANPFCITISTRFRQAAGSVDSQLANPSLTNCLRAPSAEWHAEAAKAATV